jgi:hypothetical protein
MRVNVTSTMTKQDLFISGNRRAEGGSLEWCRGQVGRNVSSMPVTSIVKRIGALFIPEEALRPNHAVLSVGLALVLALGCPAMVEAGAGDYQLLADSIANILGYPSSRLSITDVADSPKAKARGGVLAGVILEAKDGSFGTLAIGVARRGVILNSKMEAECEEAAAKGSIAGNRVEKVRFATDGYGYTGLGMAGPGGSGERIVATWPSRGLDLQIAITVPREGLVVDDATTAYQRLVNEGGPQLVEALTQAMTQLVAHVEKADLRSDDGVR